MSRNKNRKRISTKRKCKKSNKRTNISLSSLVDGAKAVGGTLLKGAKFVSEAISPFISPLRTILTGINIASGLKKILGPLFRDDDTESDTQRMKTALVTMSRTLTSKNPRMREHPLFTEMSRLYDDIDFVEQFHSTWDTIDAQRQLYDVTRRFKNILIQCDTMLQ